MIGIVVPSSISIDSFFCDESFILLKVFNNYRKDVYVVCRLLSFILLQIVHHTNAAAWKNGLIVPGGNSSINRIGREVRQVLGSKYIIIGRVPQYRALQR